MPELWTPSGGANRKLKELYVVGGGANRKLKELYAVSGGVNQKIFSGFDAQVIISVTQPASTKASTDCYMNANGSGQVFFKTESTSSSNKFSIDFTINTSSKTVELYGSVMGLRNLYYIDFGNDADTSRKWTVTPGTTTALAYANMYNIDSSTAERYYNFYAKDGGTSNSWVVHFEINLHATSSNNGTTLFRWTELRLFGSLVTNVEVIYE